MPGESAAFLRVREKRTKKTGGGAKKWGKRGWKRSLFLFRKRAETHGNLHKFRTKVGFQEKIVIFWGAGDPAASRFFVQNTPEQSEIQNFFRKNSKKGLYKGEKLC